jgi:hypothetical protein
VFMCSDGAVDSADPSDMEHGMSRLLGAACGKEPAVRLPGMVEVLRQQLAGAAAHDDIALIMVDCPQEEERLPACATDVPPAEAVHAGLMATESMRGDAPQEAWHFTLKLAAAQLRNLDIVPMLLETVKWLEHDGRDLSGQLFVVLSELFNNALDHGLLQLDSALKHDPEGMVRYFEERALRLGRLQEGEISIGLSRVSTADGLCLKIAIANSGEPFDYRSVLDDEPAPGTRRHGRGIALVKSLASELRYLDDGREVHAFLPLGSKP